MFNKMLLDNKESEPIIIDIQYIDGTDGTTTNWTKSGIDLEKDYVLFAEQYVNASPYFIDIIYLISKGELKKIFQIQSSYDSVMPVPSMSGTTLTVTRRGTYGMAVALVQLD